MPDPIAPVAPAAKGPIASIDERFAQLAAQFMAQLNAQVEALRQEFATQFGTNVDPLHRDLHDLLDQQMQAAARIEKLEAADFVTPEGLKEQADQIGDAIAEKLAPKIQPVVQPVINVTDKSLDEPVRRLERILKSF